MSGSRGKPAAADRFAALLERIAAVVGTDNLRTDPETLELLSTDFSEIRLARAAAAVSPRSTEEVSAILRLTSDARTPIVIRGGGMSYTLGYVPRDAGTLLLDMSRFDRILDVNEDSRFITVEAGVTWAAIEERLEGTGLALRFRGTMSGTRATVGGGLGNNATGHGLGDISHDLLGIEVVLADGRVIQTGGRALDPDLPGLRHAAPDLTGLFINDAGIFGVRTRATFRLYRAFPYVASIAFGFDEQAQVVDAMCDIARLDVATDVLSFGRYHHEVFAHQPPPPAHEIRAMARRIAAQAGGGWRGIRRLADMLRGGGLKGLTSVPYSVVVSCDAFDPGTAERNVAQAARVLRRFGGRRISPMLAHGLRARPFIPISSLILGRDGECSIPTNCTVPLERAREAHREIVGFFASNRAEMERRGVTHTLLMLNLGSLFGIEPILYWRDRVSPLRLEVSDPAERARLRELEDDEPTRRFVLDLRRKLARDVLRPLRAAHFQLGKYYSLEASLGSANEWAVLKTLKQALDPEGLLNPGGLGIG